MPLPQDIPTAARLYVSLLQKAQTEPHRMSKAAAIGAMYRAASHLSDLVLRDKQVPRDKVKAFEKAYRVFHRRRRPRDWNEWFDKHPGAVELLQQASTWPDKGADPARAIEFGRFTIHNQTGKDPKAALRVLERASDALEASGIPQTDLVLYGDVYIVGQIVRKRSVAARYRPDDDVILLLLVKRFAGKHEQVLLHELAHRYWAKVLTTAQKRAWLTHDRTLRTEAFQDREKVPSIGERLKYVEGEPRVTGFESGRRGLRIKVDGGWVGMTSYQNLLRKIALEERFPTPYSATEPEEHFADAFALRVLGDLDESHREAFDRIVSDRSANVARMRNRLAARS